MASKDAASEPNSAPTIKPEEAFTSSSPPKTSLAAALQALRYDHASTPNTGNVPPISKWENILMGKKWVAEHSEGDDDDNVSSRESDKYTYTPTLRKPPA